MAADAQTPGLPASMGGIPLFQEKFRFIKPTLPSWTDVSNLYEHSYETQMITNSDLVGNLEDEVEERLSVKECVAVSSCTSGLMLVMKALGLKGEVIIPSFTFFATGHAALWNGLDPVLADCYSDSWTLDPIAAERSITERTSAIIAVHLYGNPANVDALSTLATKYGLKLIFDSAHAFGSKYRGAPIGQYGDAEVFSLSPTKLLVAGEGGLVTTNDASLAAAVRAGRNYGDTGAYDPAFVGLNARMSEFNAALALAGLPLVSRKVHKHNQIAQLYTSLVSDIRGITFQSVHPQDTCTYKDYSIHINSGLFGMSRDALASALAAENIETKRYFYPPLHRQRVFSNLDHADVRLETTENVTNGILSLPIYESLPDEAVRRIAFGIRRIGTAQEHNNSSSAVQQRGV